MGSDGWGSIVGKTAPFDRHGHGIGLNLQHPLRSGSHLHRPDTHKRKGFGKGWHIAEANEQQAHESAAMAHGSAGIHGQAFDLPILCHSGFDAVEINGIRWRMLVNHDRESCLWK